MYYTGDFPPYASIAAANVKRAFKAAIYVGKAIPKGGKEGGLTKDASLGRRWLTDCNPPNPSQHPKQMPRDRAGQSRHSSVIRREHDREHARRLLRIAWVF